MVQLPNIARPVIAPQVGHGLGGDVLNREGSAVPHNPVEAVLGVDDLADAWSFPDRSLSYVAHLVPVACLHTRSHHITPYELCRHARHDTSTTRTAMLPRVAFA